MDRKGTFFSWKKIKNCKIHRKTSSLRSLNNLVENYKVHRSIQLFEMGFAPFFRIKNNIVLRKLRPKTVYVQKSCLFPWYFSSHFSIIFSDPAVWETQPEHAPILRFFLVKLKFNLEPISIKLEAEVEFSREIEVQLYAKFQLLKKKHDKKWGFLDTLGDQGRLKNVKPTIIA